MRHFNGLSPAEAERLALAMEEMAEAQQMIGKILRHGYNSTHADYGGASNRELLEKEVGHVIAAFDLLCGVNEDRRHDLNSSAVEFQRQTKHERMKQYLHHQVTA